MMKRLQWKIVNAAFWAEIALSYFLPFRVTDDFQYQIGFPIPFLSMYDAKFGVSPFASMHFNPLALLCNGAILYLVFAACAAAYQRLKRRGVK